MAIKTGILFCTLLVGAFALKPSDVGLAQFFDEEVKVVETEDVGAQGRIVGGRVAPLGSHPWMVAITVAGTTRNMWCGGSVLTPRTVLTAAHCFYTLREGNTLRSDVRLHVGTNQFRSGGQTLFVDSFVLHPAYVHEVPPRHDIGTLFPTTPIIFNQLVRAIPMSWDYIGGNVEARVAGWGLTSIFNTGIAPANLMELDTPTITEQRCAEEVSRRFTSVNTTIEICTFHSFFHGVCSGDSGSALVRRDNDQQIGIVAWGFPCARGGPDMFTRISAFRSFIEQNTRL